MTSSRETPDEYAELNRLRLVYALRTGFGPSVTFPPRFVENAKIRIRMTLRGLLIEEGQHWPPRLPPTLADKQRRHWVRQAVRDILGRLDQRIRRGEVPFFTQQFLKDQFRGQKSRDFPKWKARTGVLVEAVSPEATEPAWDKDEVETAQAYYEKLCRLLQRHLQALLDEWIRTGGSAWLSPYIRGLTATPEEHEALYRKAYHKWLPFLRQRILKTFPPESSLWWPLQDSAKQKKEEWGDISDKQKVKWLIGCLHNHGVGPAHQDVASETDDAGRRIDGAAPLPQPAQDSGQSPPESDYPRIVWLLRRQKWRMHQWVKENYDEARRLTRLLRAYSLGVREDRIVAVLYRGVPDPWECLCCDLAELQKPYREITAEAVSIINAWKSYDNLEGRGFDKAPKYLQYHPEAGVFQALIDAARKRVEFLHLPRDEGLARCGLSGLEAVRDALAEMIPYLTKMEKLERFYKGIGQSPESQRFLNELRNRKEEYDRFQPIVQARNRDAAFLDLGRDCDGLSFDDVCERLKKMADECQKNQ